MQKAIIAGAFAIALAAMALIAAGGAKMKITSSRRCKHSIKI
jgi:hypothetical protein